MLLHALPILPQGLQTSLLSNSAFSQNRFSPRLQSEGFSFWNQRRLIALCRIIYFPSILYMYSFPIAFFVFDTKMRMNYLIITTPRLLALLNSNIENSNFKDNFTLFCSILANILVCHRATSSVPDFNKSWQIINLYLKLVSYKGNVWVINRFWGTKTQYEIWHRLISLVFYF